MDDLEPSVNRINSRGFKHFEHFRMKNGLDFENSAIKLLNLQGIPFIVLVDSQGKIVYKGYSSNLEDKINALISDME